MYIRNSRGQLVWIPPQESLQAAQTALESMQQNMRQQMQRDEWMRFNAPPVDDNLCFHDQYSVYEGSLSHGYHNVVHQSHSPAMSHNGNPVYNGQQPYNQVDPPIPRVINSTQAIPRPHQNVAPIPQVIRSIPAFPNPRQAVGGDIMTQSSRGSHPNPRLQGHRTNMGPDMITTVPRVIYSEPKLQGTRQNNGADMMAQISPSINSTPIVRGPRQRIGGDLMGLKSNTPEVFNTVYHQSQNNIDVIEEESIYDPSQNKFHMVQDEESIYDPSRNKIHMVQDEFIPEVNTSCLSTIFGSSIGLYELKPRSRKAHMINCNALNLSISDGDDSDLSSFITHSEKSDSSIKSDGVRGLGKKIDHVGEQKSVLVDKEALSKETTVMNPKNTSQMGDSIISKSELGNQEKIEDNVASKSFQNEAELSLLTSERENIESCLSTNAIAEQTSEEYSSVVPQAHTVDSRRDQTRIQQVNSDPSNVGNISDVRKHSNVGSITTDMCKSRDIMTMKGLIIEEEYPSFDEPAKPKNDVVNNIDQSTYTCPSTESVSDGENTQKNANVDPTVERMSVSKRYMLKSRKNARRQRAVMSENDGVKPLVV